MRLMMEAADERTMLMTTTTASPTADRGREGEAAPAPPTPVATATTTISMAGSDYAFLESLPFLILYTHKPGYYMCMDTVGRGDSREGLGGTAPQAKASREIYYAVNALGRESHSRKARRGAQSRQMLHFYSGGSKMHPRVVVVY